MHNYDDDTSCLEDILDLVVFLLPKNLFEAILALCLFASSFFLFWVLS